MHRFFSNGINLDSMEYSQFSCVNTITNYKVFLYLNTFSVTLFRIASGDSVSEVAKAVYCLLVKFITILICFLNVTINVILSFLSFSF